MPAKNEIESASRLSLVERLFARLTARRGARERGTIIVLALAVLAVLALAAVSYVSVVRLDRRSSAAIAHVRDYERQSKAVVGHIGALLTADLFGNKIVTRDVPEIGTADMQSAWGNLRDVRLWPKMFEDGETWDTPTVDETWRRVDRIDDAEDDDDDPFVLVPSGAWGIDPDESVARPDDAWLASSEPNWANAPYTGGVNQTFEWKQISNLRSAYTWGRNPRTNRFEWRRGDGKFVNLASYFDNPNLRDGRPNMGLDLFHIDNGGNYDTHFAIDGLGNGATRRNPTAVFDKQMDEIWNAPSAGPTTPRLTPADEAEWVDTDADLRADSRWTKLDVLGDLYGLNWFVAARIVDASALMNINASIEAPSWNINNWMPQGAAQTTKFDLVFDGQTPADIDLYRLLGYDYEIQSPNNGTYFRPLNFTNYRGTGAGFAFADHVDIGLNMGEVIADLQDTAGYKDHERLGQTMLPTLLYQHQAYRGWLAYASGFNYEPLTRAQRAAWWEYAGSSPRDPVLATARAYPVRSLIDLRSFWGTNNTSLVTKFEQYVDGPDDGGFLPTITPAANEQYGPMRSREGGASSRSFTDNKPTLAALFQDVRRHLTPVSGQGNFSPVPAINRTRFGNEVNKFENVYFNTKVSLPALKRAGDSVYTGTGTPVSDEDARRVFESFVWALAPLATDTSLAPNLPNANDFTLLDQAFHYGGGADMGGIGASGYARALGDFNGQNIGPAYALMRAGALTVNLIDAMDYADEDPLDATYVPEKPTVLRFYPNPANDFTTAQNPNGDELRVNGRLSQGDLPNLNTADKYLGTVSGEGVSFIGLDRQPFLREVHFFGAYQNSAAHPGGTRDPVELNVTIDPTNASHQLGSLIAVELGNPWPDTINVENYRVRLTSPTGRNLTLKLNTAGSPTIDPGQSAVFVWHSGTAVNTTGVATSPFLGTIWQELFDRWKTQIPGTVYELTPDYPYDPGTGLVETGIILDAGHTHTPVVFADFVGQEMQPVLLLTTEAGSPTNSEILVDRLWKSPVQDFPFDNAAKTFNGGGGLVAVDDELVVRMTINGTIDRPTETTAGFPAYVVERPVGNHTEFYIPPDNSTGDQVQFFTQAAVNAEDTFIVGEGSFDALANDPPGDARRLGEPKGTFATSTPPAFFQLFVPERRLAYVSDLAMLPAYCTMYVHSAPGVPLIDNANVHPLNSASPLFGPGYWITFAEQMGLESEMFLDYDGTGTGLTNPNPYWGVINPVDFILSDPLVGNVPPGYANYAFHESLKVPLGTRIFEPFEALDPKGDTGFIEGRININTATQRVVEAFSPMLNPVDDTVNGTLAPLTMGGDMTVQDPAANAPESRSALLLDYRDLKGTDFAGPSPTVRADKLGLPVRVRDQSLGFNLPGFINLGELSILAGWFRDTLEPSPLISSSIPYRDMLELGYDNNGGPVNSQGLPFKWWANDNPMLTRDPSALVAPFPAYALPTYDPPNDPEERLAIFRAISNLVSTRSDVFMATFVIRGYNPDRVENIEPLSTGPEQSMSQLDDQAFEPAYEARYLAVFDRSKVRSPIDRPEVLLVVELPAGQ
ncbi:MAG: hypothetical protein KDA20_01460 [Phycisphaerales bacterium]|nr:hypothetical protein [Phycisphaerales bacterium]